MAPALDRAWIPERIVHARGSGAHGYFECYEPLTGLTRASLFSAAGKRTPVFVRFSTVVNKRGSTDTGRDVRGFAVRFYTDEGNWDLAGNNILVLFIQDAMKFPSPVHATNPSSGNNASALRAFSPLAAACHGEEFTRQSRHAMQHYNVRSGRGCSLQYCRGWRQDTVCSNVSEVLFKFVSYPAVAK
jgi:catalase